ncbi:PaaI family thioesterase [Paenibacillus alkalitolerans]|uniref:PaaI family thioesterase n=1 Tax=Paenibacillus alkalitolerans TaxID=2799335 RepID=UPI0018F282B5|nr:PaaI family thioesterase [Paenibacillus alkalitolerans]
MEHKESIEREAWFAQLAERAKGTFWELIGCKVEAVEPGRAVVALDAQQHHLNGIGIVHGGVLSSLLDNAMGIAAMSARPGESTVTTNLNVHFVAPLGTGKLIATATVLHQSRSTLTVQATVQDDAGKTGSIGTGSFRVIPHR